MSVFLNSIRIGIDPDMAEIGSFVLTWHGFFTFVAVAVAVLLVAYWGKKEGIKADSVYSVSVWAIVSGIIGARLLHVIDFWGRIYKNDPVSVLYFWQGGVTIYGAILGGFLGAALYMIIRNRDGFIGFWNSYLGWLGRLTKLDLPSVGRLADISTPALLIAMAIGRIGDIINGEHFSKATSLPWGFVYTHPKTVALYAQSAPIPASIPSHPEVAYELIMDLFILGALWLVFRNRLRPHGMLFATYLAAYSLGRFFLSFLREDKTWVVGLNEAQIVALIVLAITVTVLISKAQIVQPIQRPRTSAPKTASSED